MDNLKKEMGLRVKSRRKKLMLTQEEVSEKLGISVKHLSEFERGLSGLSIENLIKLSDVLELTLDYLIKGETENYNWDSVLSVLQCVPKGKEEQIKDLIQVGIRLIEN